MSRRGFIPRLSGSGGRHRFDCKELVVILVDLNKGGCGHNAISEVRKKSEGSSSARSYIVDLEV